MTKKEKAIIRSHYSYFHAIRFRADGSVEAQQRPGAPFGLLYSVVDARRHIEALRK